MAAWQDNAIMYWDGSKVTDHNRSSLSVTFERIGNDERMINATKRRQQVAIKRSWSVSWEMLPSKTTSGGVQTVDAGWNGTQIEDFVQSPAGSNAFRMIIRAGSASGKTNPTTTTVPDSQLPFDDGDFEVTKVMITDYSKEVVKRGAKTDFWNVSVTLEEV